jgi:hypothetical protein
MPRMTVAVLVAIGFSAVLGLAAQSPTPFGIPSADQPTPASAIPAVPGSRAQGWLAQGRSEVLARHGVVATSDRWRRRPASRSCGARERDRRGRGGGRCRRHQNDTGSAVIRSRKLVGSRQEALRARVGGVGARRVDAAILHRPTSRQERAQQRRQRRDRPRRDRRL